MDKIKISKQLSTLLRHGHPDIPINDDGFVLVSDLNKFNNLKHLKLSDLKNIVSNCPKQRFYLKLFNIKDMDVWMIRANQGHSINVNIEMKTLKAQDILVCIHGTYLKKLPLILEKGLNKMKRQHIHFTQTKSDNPNQSGIRSSCDILIYLNIELRIKDGIVFYLSLNNVILTSGIDGWIPVKYFEKIVKRNDQNVNLFEVNIDF